MKDNGSVLTCKGLSKSFGRKKALDGLDLEAAAGEVTGILGRNGSGKSTLFKIVLDLIAPDSGVVSALGLTPDGSGKLRGLIGYVPEKPAFHPFMTVAETLDFRASFFSRWDKAKAAGLCKALELDTKARAGDLSKGNTAKLAWICATAHNPALLLLDEPTSGLDYLVRDHLLNGLVSELAEGGRTIIVSDHRMGELGGLLDRVCVLSGGRIKTDHRAEFIKTETYKVTVRETAPLPELPGVKVLGRAGSVTELAVFGRDRLQELKKGGKIEGAEISALDLDSAFKALLGE